MATVTWSYDDGFGTINTGVSIMDSPVTQYITNSTFTLAIPSHYVRGTSSYVSSSASRYYKLQYGFYDGSTRIGYTGLRDSLVTNTVSNSSVNATVPASASTSSLTTYSYFSSSNPTTRVVPISIRHEDGAIVSGGAEYIWNSANSSSSGAVVGTINLTLNAPPTFTVSSLSIDTAYIYTGLTTASVSVSSLSAKYGGSISEVKFTIGSQSVTRTDAGTLSILLENVGTFTPTVTVTDSRGQTTTKSLDAITVNGYVAPSVSFTGDRTLSTGVPDDEGAYITVDATFLYTDVVATLVEPSVTMTDSNGTATTPVVTWYSTRASDGTLSGSVTWSSVARGQTVYGLIPNANTQYSYQVSIRPRDSEGTGTAISQTIASAFYTVDFLAGGHGIAFGKPASETGFECAMPATFEDEVYIDISDYATSGTTDKAIYDAIVSLGWDSDVLVN